MGDFVFAKGDIVWFKMTRLPHWPCKIVDIEEENGRERFDIMFYGDETVESTFNPKTLWPLRCENHDAFVAKLKSSKQSDARRYGAKALEDVR